MKARIWGALIGLIFSLIITSFSLIRIIPGKLSLLITPLATIFTFPATILSRFIFGTLLRQQTYSNILWMRWPWGLILIAIVWILIGWVAGAVIDFIRKKPVTLYPTAQAKEFDRFIETEQ
ncbi:MAG: hypothetical protein AABX12_01975 [Nanoarchaeota archaeon]